MRRKDTLAIGIGLVSTAISLSLIFFIQAKRDEIVQAFSSRIVGTVLGRTMEHNIGDAYDGESLIAKAYILKVYEPMYSKIPILPIAFNRPTPVFCKPWQYSGSQKIRDGQVISTERRFFNEE